MAWPVSAYNSKPPPLSGPGNNGFNSQAARTGYSKSSSALPAPIRSRPRSAARLATTQIRGQHRAGVEAAQRRRRGEARTRHASDTTFPRNGYPSEHFVPASGSGDAWRGPAAHESEVADDRGDAESLASESENGRRTPSILHVMVDLMLPSPESSGSRAAARATTRAGAGFRPSSASKRRNGSSGMSSGRSRPQSAVSKRGSRWDPTARESKSNTASRMERFGANKSSRARPAKPVLAATLPGETGWSEDLESLRHRIMEAKLSSQAVGTSGSTSAVRHGLIPQHFVFVVPGAGEVAPRQESLISVSQVRSQARPETLTEWLSRRAVAQAGGIDGLMHESSVDLPYSGTKRAGSSSNHQVKTDRDLITLTDAEESDWAMHIPLSSHFTIIIRPSMAALSARARQRITGTRPLSSTAARARRPATGPPVRQHRAAARHADHKGAYSRGGQSGAAPHSAQQSGAEFSKRPKRERHRHTPAQDDRHVSSEPVHQLLPGQPHPRPEGAVEGSSRHDPRLVSLGARDLESPMDSAMLRGPSGSPTALAAGGSTGMFRFSHVGQWRDLSMASAAPTDPGLYENPSATGSLGQLESFAAGPVPMSGVTGGLGNHYRGVGAGGSRGLFHSTGVDNAHGQASELLLHGTTDDEEPGHTWERSAQDTRRNVAGGSSRLAAELPPVTSSRSSRAGSLAMQLDDLTGTRHLPTTGTDDDDSDVAPHASRRFEVDSIGTAKLLHRHSGLPAPLRDVTVQGRGQQRTNVSSSSAAGDGGGLSRGHQLKQSNGDGDVPHRETGPRQVQHLTPSSPQQIIVTYPPPHVSGGASTAVGALGDRPAAPHSSQSYGVLPSATDGIAAGGHRSRVGHDQTTATQALEASLVAMEAAGSSSASHDPALATALAKVAQSLQQLIHESSPPRSQDPSSGTYGAPLPYLGEGLASDSVVEREAVSLVRNRREAAIAKTSALQNHQERLRLAEQRVVLREHHAAVSIQRVARGRRSRAELAKQQEQHAAVSIQRVARGRRSRAELAKQQEQQSGHQDPPSASSENVAEQAFFVVPSLQADKQSHKTWADDSFALSAPADLEESFMQGGWWPDVSQESEPKQSMPLRRGVSWRPEALEIVDEAAELGFEHRASSTITPAAATDDGSALAHPGTPPSRLSPSRYAPLRRHHTAAAGGWPGENGGGFKGQASAGYAPTMSKRGVSPSPKRQALLQRAVAMHGAAMRGDRDSVFRLVAGGPESMELKDALGRTILHHMAAAGRVEMLKELVAMDGDVIIDERDLAGDSPLTLALCLSDNALATARALLEAGANSTIPGRGDVLPIDIARAAGNVELVELVKQYL